MWRVFGVWGRARLKIGRGCFRRGGCVGKEDGWGLGGLGLLSGLREGLGIKG